ncbi:hypothetical protein EGW08_004736 [Elysia chlorotica]|uniref:HAT C-terminal dimerisation domain-containing protein n=1 Tax=Elysia chlorotica TaxID=188477 RepID=A0A3S1BS56_ELYCH|nr:hypothetical protein EGW08_004736 [Elysia chlorotica]
MYYVHIKKQANTCLKKFPIPNKNLALLSTIDPELCGHSAAAKGLQDLFDLFPTIVDTSTTSKDQFSMAASVLQNDTNFTSTITDKKLDTWLANVLANPNYKLLRPVVKSFLSIFTGPRVESSFSVMNNIITSSTNRTLIETYQAIHKVKYKLLNAQKTSTQMFERKDPVHSPVDPSLCYYVQTAAKRMVTAKRNISRRIPKVPKTTVHIQTNAIRTAIEDNAIAASCSVASTSSTSTACENASPTANMSSTNTIAAVGSTSDKKLHNKRKAPEHSLKPSAKKTCGNLMAYLKRH